jgi:hypothetical protein
LPTAWNATDQRDIEDAIEICMPERIIVLRDADDRCLRAKRRNVLEAPLPVAWAMPRRRHTRPPAHRRAQLPHLPAERQGLGLDGAGEAARARRGVGCVQRWSLIVLRLLNPEPCPMMPQAARRRQPNLCLEPSRLASPELPRTRSRGPSLASQSSKRSPVNTATTNSATALSGLH